MSERSSFVTERIYCKKCLDKMKEALLVNHRYLDSIQVPAGDAAGGHHPIIAGYIGGLGPGDEIQLLMDIFNRETAPCHPVRLCILEDCGDSNIWVVMPNGCLYPVGGVSRHTLRENAESTE